ncbi:hypothetical protein BG004_002386, partial [Podila humilis]
DKLHDSFADEDSPSSPSMRYSFPRSKERRPAPLPERSLDNASNKNYDRPVSVVAAGGAKYTDNDDDQEDHDVPVSPDDDEEEIQEIEGALATSQSPFLPLLEYLYKKVKGHDPELPRAPKTFLCQEYKELYEYAHSRVALSGIVNTLAPSAKVLSFAPAMEADCLLEALEEKDEDVAELMSELVEAYSPGHAKDPLAPLEMDCLRRKVWGLLIEHSAASPRAKIVRRKMQVLQVVDYICTLISTNQVTPPLTEHVVVSVWSFILAVMLGGQVVRGIPGELASQAAKAVRLYVEGEYGVTTKNVGGRKVDISVRVFANNSWDNEISIFEFKTSKATDLICEQQQRKSVRLNTAILHDLEHKGIDTSNHFPIIAEGRDCCLSLYTLKRKGNVMVAGKSTREVAWIPSDMVQLKQFLKSDSIHVLLNFADHTARYAVHVQEALSMIRRPPLPSTPPPRFNKPFAAFTPHKQNRPNKQIKRKDPEVTFEDHEYVDQDSEEEME